MKPIEELLRYVEKVTGTAPATKLLSERAAARLPLYLAHAYTIHEIRLFGREFFLAVPKTNEKPELARWAKDREQLSARLDKEVVLVLANIRSYERTRLIHRHVPFIVPGSQMFLPMLMIDLRETFPKKLGRGNRLSWVSQAILLRHLVREDIQNRPFGAIAETLGYSAMAITQAFDELSAANLCQRLSHGRTKSAYFERAPKNLWGEVQSRLRTPVKRLYFLDRITPQLKPMLKAGLTALSEKTDMASPSRPVFAVEDKVLRKVLTEEQLEISLLEEDASAVLEAWFYAPQIISAEAQVDPFSLYLSLKDDPDERVQMALDQLLEEWK